MAWLGCDRFTGLGMENAADRGSTGLGQLWAFRLAKKGVSNGRRTAATLDVYRPSGTSNASGSERLRPAVLAIHGGSWNGGSKTAFRYDPRKGGHSAGTAGIGRVRDRLSARPAGRSRAGRRSLTTFAKPCAGCAGIPTEFGIDPGRIAVMGQSSGGHLAALLATLPEEQGPDGVSSRVQAVVSFYGPSDLPDLMSFRRLAHEPARAFLGDAVSGPTDRRPTLHRSSTSRPDDPPMLLIHGTDDAWVPLDQSVRMAAALDQAPASHTG